MEFEDIGKLEFFNSEPFIKAADILVAADEPIRALQLLSNLPGYYRENPPPEITQHKIDIQCLLATPVYYQTEDRGTITTYDVLKDTIKDMLRWVQIRDDVKLLNDKGITPHIMDYGPGEFWLPVMLDGVGLKFTYNDIGLCTRSKISELLGSRYRKPEHGDFVIFVACEIIEHLHYENDVSVECYRAGVIPDIFHISTPKYTFDGRQERIDWKSHGTLGHLRTYTLNEFIQVVYKMFPGYTLRIFDSQIMHIKGEK